MMQPHVRITLQLAHFPRMEDEHVVLPMSEYSVREAMEKLDYPVPEANEIVVATFCTPRDIIKKTEIDRERLAEAVAVAVKGKLIELLGANDTVMGNKKRG